MPTEVIQDASMSRFELLVDGVSVGEVDYQERGGEIVFIHTEIDPAYRGAGLGSELARGALNLVRAESDARIVAGCPFIRAWLAKNPSYGDLLTR